MTAVRDRGSVSVLAAAAVAVAALLGTVAVWIAMVGTAQVRVSQAADLAALAGAEKAWFDRSAACAVAEEIAARHRAQVISCRAVGLDVQVQVRAPLTGLFSGAGQVTATARAGPPES